jgi:hypothetical protein
MLRPFNAVRDSPSSPIETGLLRYATTEARIYRINPFTPTQGNGAQLLSTPYDGICMLPIRLTRLLSTLPSILSVVVLAFCRGLAEVPLTGSLARTSTTESARYGHR